LGTSDGPRAWYCFGLFFCCNRFHRPIAAAIGTGTIQTSINNASFSQQMDVYPALMRYGEWEKDRFGVLSTAPAQLDQFQNYGDWTTYGSGRNPLANCKSAFGLKRSDLAEQMARTARKCHGAASRA